jgi:hypothetical protein
MATKVEELREDLIYNFPDHAADQIRMINDFEQAIREESSAEVAPRPVTTHWQVQSDWDANGRWKNMGEPFDSASDAIEIIRQYDGYERNPMPRFRLAEVKVDIIWTGDFSHVLG